MEPARGEEASTHADPSLAVRTTDIEDLSIQGFFDVARADSVDAAPADASARPRVVWRPPEGDFLAAIGASASCVADGAGRFGSIREEGSELFAALETDPEAPRVARPRLFGGFSFLPDTHSGPWKGVPDARFVLPKVQFASTEAESWLTVIGDSEGIEARLADWRDRVAAVLDSPSRAAPSIEHAERTTSRARWHEQVETALSRIDSAALRKVVLGVGSSPFDRARECAGRNVLSPHGDEAFGRRAEEIPPSLIRREREAETLRVAPGQLRERPGHRDGVVEAHR